MKNYGTPTRWGYRVPCSDDQGGLFVYVKEILRCRTVSFSRCHCQGVVYYEYADSRTGEREYYSEARQGECFDLFLEMVTFEVVKEFYKYFREELEEKVAELNLKKVTE